MTDVKNMSFADLKDLADADAGNLDPESAALVAAAEKELAARRRARRERGLDDDNRLSNDQILASLKAIADEMNARFKEGSFGQDDRVLHVFNAMTLAQHLVNGDIRAAREVALAMGTRLEQQTWRDRNG